MKKTLALGILTLSLAGNALAYYQAEQGRWLNRDPIEERGGVNVYAFVKNNSVNVIDPIGLEGVNTGPQAGRGTPVASPSMGSADDALDSDYLPGDNTLDSTIENVFENSGVDAYNTLVNNAWLMDVIRKWGDLERVISKKYTKCYLHCYQCRGGQINVHRAKGRITKEVYKRRSRVGEFWLERPSGGGMDHFIIFSDDFGPKQTRVIPCDAECPEGWVDTKAQLTDTTDPNLRPI